MAIADMRRQHGLRTIPARAIARRRAAKLRQNP
jgi:hypothetical protein